MKCNRCSNPAILHITELTQGVAKETHLCEECAQQYLNPSQAQSSSEQSSGAMIKVADPANEAQLEELDRMVCPNCGITFREFRSQGRLGCPHDYIAFQDELQPLLENIHGETQHCGKFPKRAPDDSLKQFRLIKLRNDLRLAVAEESYERAAKLRDEIQALESELKRPSPKSD
jgi:protein arginine kinase activator